MALLVVQIGRKIEDEITNHFPEEKNLFILSYINQMTFKGTEIKNLAEEFYRQLKKMATDKTEPLKIVLSGPVVLSFILGMVTGIDQFNVQLYHLDMTENREEYIYVEMPQRSWVNE